MAQKILFSLALILFTAIFGTTAKPASDFKIGMPVRLLIPSIGVDAPIISIGTASDGSIGVPSGPYETAWFNASPRPGEKGSSIITGHFGRWRSGAESVFDNLNKLKPGDKIYVRDENGNLISFTIQETQVYKSSDSVPEIFEANGYYLNLITCNGTWLPDKKTFTNRLIVFSKKDQ